MEPVTVGYAAFVYPKTVPEVENTSPLPAYASASAWWAARFSVEVNSPLSTARPRVSYFTKDHRFAGDCSPSWVKIKRSRLS